ncbi:MAG: glycine C-acetyltransferase [Pseudomonadota bacterium]
MIARLEQIVRHMSKKSLLSNLKQQTQTLHEQGLFKQEHAITSTQGTEISVHGYLHPLLNFCANNYLGLAGNPVVISKAKQSLDAFGYGLASVRFICGTQSPHQHLEKRLSQFSGLEDTILFPSCFAANLGLFQTLFEQSDAIISDALNHASLIDGIRLCKADRYLYANNDMSELEAQLQKTQHHRYRVIVTDGVFSMDGIIANLPDICDLAEAYDALVVVDDAHGVGAIGPDGKGTPAYYGIQDRVDIVTGTLGKALGGAIGGYISGKHEVVEWLRQRSRTYLFSNSLPPMVPEVTLKALEALETDPTLMQKLSNNSQQFRQGMTQLGFNLIPGAHPIVPVMIGDAVQAKQFADGLLEQGIYVISFSFPVVPQGEARIRVQLSAAHTQNQVERAIAGFGEVGRALGVID